jgi:response regulator NasT
MTEPEAFTWMQRAAMDQRTTMKRVAEVVLETLQIAGDAPGDAPSSQ